MNKIEHKVFVNGELKYEFMASIWYDTASPAQACISQLKQIQNLVGNVVIYSFGNEYKISTIESFKDWVKNVFSPTGISYQCDFSIYL